MILQSAVRGKCENPSKKGLSFWSIMGSSFISQPQNQNPISKKTNNFGKRSRHFYILCKKPKIFHDRVSNHDCILAVDEVVDFMLAYWVSSSFRNYATLEIFKPLLCCKFWVLIVSPLLLRQKFVQTDKHFSQSACPLVLEDKFLSIRWTSTSSSLVWKLSTRILVQLVHSVVHYPPPLLDVCDRLGTFSSFKTSICYLRGLSR
jgi:hypothetical protein